MLENGYILRSHKMISLNVARGLSGMKEVRDLHSKSPKKKKDYSADKLKIYDPQIQFNINRPILQKRHSSVSM